MKLPYVKECLIVARRNKNSSLIVARILPDGGCGGIEEDIKKINESLPYYMRIDAYELEDREFDKTSTNKIIRSNYV